MALPILSGIFLVLWGLVAFKKPDLVWKIEFCIIDEPSESYLFFTKLKGIMAILLGIALIVLGPFLV